jgi:hypothetical protein
LEQHIIQGRRSHPKASGHDGARIVFVATTTGFPLGCKTLGILVLLCGQDAEQENYPDESRHGPGTRMHIDMLSDQVVGMNTHCRYDYPIVIILAIQASLLQQERSEWSLTRRIGAVRYVFEQTRVSHDSI